MTDGALDVLVIFGSLRNSPFMRRWRDIRIP